MHDKSTIFTTFTIVFKTAPVQAS